MAENRIKKMNFKRTEISTNSSLSSLFCHHESQASAVLCCAVLTASPQVYVCYLDVLLCHTAVGATSVDAENTFAMVKAKALDERRDSVSSSFFLQGLICLLLFVCLWQ